MYITKKELSEKLSISIATIDRNMREGMPYIKMERAVRFKFDEVEEWLLKRGEK